MKRVEIAAVGIFFMVIVLAAVVIYLYFDFAKRCTDAGMDSIAIQGAVFCVDSEGRVWRLKK